MWLIVVMIGLCIVGSGFSLLAAFANRREVKTERVSFEETGTGTFNAANWAMWDGGDPSGNCL